VRETKAQKAARAGAILDGLEAQMPGARIELDYETPLELLVAVMLSAQCTDKRVNLVTPALFQRYRTAADYGAADVAEVEGYIRTCGLYRNKAKNLVATGKLLAEAHGGQVPLDREVLQGLPGVGRKTAGVVTTHLGGTPAFPVDTHIQRLAGRMGLSSARTPDGVEGDLRALVPEARWTNGHQLLIWHGRRTCAARAPACDRCTVHAHCPRRGVKAP
jgi:endonuclease-3